MKFAMSYSFGKDSTLALWRMLQLGHTPVCLITTVNEAFDRTWFHGIGADLRAAVARRMQLPLLTSVCGPDDYVEQMEKTLVKARELGAEACAFGDIDIEDHQAWNRDRCAAAKLHCMVPLWHNGREAVVREVIDSGIKAVVKCTQNAYTGLLGKTLDDHLLEELRTTGADLCGENGEYHTFVYDGPMFTAPVDIRLGEVIPFDTHSVIDITCGEV